MASSPDFHANDQQVVLYESHDHTVHLDVRMDKDTVWLTRQQLALLFGRDIKTIGKHIGNAKREELEGIPVVAKFATTAADGKTYQVEHYNLDMILSIGYRVKSQEGVYFRRWANTVLKQHLTQGYTVNQRRLETLNSSERITAMYELNGIVYAGEATPELKVTAARVTNDWMMLITFSNGETRIFDGTRLWGKPVYEPLRSQNIFNNFAVDHGILTWDNDRIDIGTNNLYELCYPYDAPITDGNGIIRPQRELVH